MEGAAGGSVSTWPGLVGSGGGGRGPAWARRCGRRLEDRTCGAPGPGEDVLDLRSGHHEVARAEAVATTVPGGLVYAADEVDRQILTRRRVPAVAGAPG